MFKKLVAPTAAAVLLASTAAFAETTVRNVQVDVDLSAIQNEAAAAYWTSVAGDLETAIVARLTDQIADDGATVTVDIDELSLANSFQSVLGIEKSELSGSVAVNNLQDNSEHQAYELTVSFEPAPIVLSPDADLLFITRSTSQYYADMVSTFAEHVTDKLQ
ncbi:hypothetical protein [Litoreibacter janthinus]|uniref:Uncharacterized protein n=1 Tax=Litoreibacter janthinus TaxID=670154 RepID=A0A1I6IFQ5_9RHOB|nr:hypothetical protein [Litoreibacter janthinus]SFR65484.1 hypothetical protein SAMN04488002_3775 [Litoreibacter janthinus]